MITAKFTAEYCQYKILQIGWYESIITKAYFMEYGILYTLHNQYW